MRRTHTAVSDLKQYRISLGIGGHDAIIKKADDDGRLRD